MALRFGLWIDEVGLWDIPDHPLQVGPSDAAPKPGSRQAFAGYHIYAVLLDRRGTGLSELKIAGLGVAFDPITQAEGSTNTCVQAGHHRLPECHPSYIRPSICTSLAHRF